LEAVEAPFAGAHADEAERGVADGSRHAAHLAVASFGERDLEPGCRNGFAEADGRIARREIGFGGKQTDLRGARGVVLDAYSLAEGV